VSNSAFWQHQANGQCKTVFMYCDWQYQMSHSEGHGDSTGRYPSGTLSEYLLPHSFAILPLPDSIQYNSVVQLSHILRQALVT
jgi:hypothetical protein